MEPSNPLGFAPANPSQPLIGNTQQDNPLGFQSALQGANMAAQASGHSTGVMQSILKGAASATLPNPQSTFDTGMGGIKQAVKDISSAGAQNAGPVGAAMTASADSAAAKNGTPAFSQGFNDLNQATTPSNPTQQMGAMMTSIGEGMIPTGAATDAVKSSGLLSKIGDMTGINDWLAKRATSKAINAVASTADTMTKGERETAIAGGRQQAGFLSNSFVPSQTESRAGEILTGKVSGNPIKDVPIVQGEIASRGKEAETFLEANAKPITNQEDFNAFAKQREVSSTYLTPTAEKAYDEQMNVFQKVLKGYVKDGGYNTSNYYQALKEFESNVTQNLPKGKEALLDEGGSARLQAAKDVRHVVRDMIGQKNPEFKDKMFDLTSLYDARDNVITKAEKSGHGLQQLIKKYPKTSGVIGTLGGIQANKALKDTTGFGF